MHLDQGMESSNCSPANTAHGSLQSTIIVQASEKPGDTVDSSVTSPLLASESSSSQGMSIIYTTYPFCLSVLSIHD